MTNERTLVTELCCVTHRSKLRFANDDRDIDRCHGLSNTGTESRKLKMPVDLSAGIQEEVQDESVKEHEVPDEHELIAFVRHRDIHPVPSQHFICPGIADDV